VEPDPAPEPEAKGAEVRPLAPGRGG